MPPARSAANGKGRGGAPSAKGGRDAKDRKGGSVAIAAGAAAAAGAGTLDTDEGSGEESEDEESEEAQVCWSVVFAFLPVILEVGMEFAGAAMDAGICQYLAMLLLPIYQGIKALFGIANAPPAPPTNAPPAPPPPPSMPDLVTRVSVAMFDFAEEVRMAGLLANAAHSPIVDRWRMQQFASRALAGMGFVVTTAPLPLAQGAT
mgnify:CR=1 FL=1